MNSKGSAGESPLAAFGVTVAYRNTPVLTDLSFRVPAGTLTAIVGPNGAGKSTLIKTALGLVHPLTGHFEFFGKSFREVDGRISYVPQRTSVDWDFPVTALDVVCMGLYRKIGWFRPVRARHRKRAMEALTEVGMQDYAKRQISQLSGGQQQRVAIARAIAGNRPLLLADEPTGNLDIASGADVLRLFKSLCHDEENPISILMVTHDPDLVSQADRMLLLRDGTVAASDIRSAWGLDEEGGEEE